MPHLRRSLRLAAVRTPPLSAYDEELRRGPPAREVARARRAPTGWCSSPPTPRATSPTPATCTTTPSSGGSATCTSSRWASGRAGTSVHADRGPGRLDGRERYKSKFSHATEEASAGYYKVGLDTYGITAELTAGLRVGHAPVHVPAGRPGQRPARHRHGRSPAGPTTTPQRTDGQNGAQARDLPDRGRSLGTANRASKAPRTTTPCTSRPASTARSPATACGRAAGPPCSRESRPSTGAGAGAYVSFDGLGPRRGGEGRDLVRQPANALGEPRVRDARRGLRVRRAARAHAGGVERCAAHDRGRGRRRSWTRPASTRRCTTRSTTPTCSTTRTATTSGTTARFTRIGSPGDPMPAGSTHYANFSMWDTYRGEMQLLVLIAPDRVAGHDAVVGRDRSAGRPAAAMGPDERLRRLHERRAGAARRSPTATAAGSFPTTWPRSYTRRPRELALVDRRDPAYLEKGYVPHTRAAAPAGRSSTRSRTSRSRSSRTARERRGSRRLLELAGSWRNISTPRPASCGRGSPTARG